jgi:hypothetical protein
MGFPKSFLRLRGFPGCEHELAGLRDYETTSSCYGEAGADTCIWVRQSTYAGSNLIWNPAGSLNVGGEFLYGRKMPQNGAQASDPRNPFNSRYSFVKVDRVESASSVKRNIAERLGF